ncbi:MAG: hypothetical protein MJ181_06550 [Treponema sp.]|nr:hypothetical protein [Treponema sp.]
MMKKKWMPLLALVAALGLVFAGCKKPDDIGSSQPEQLEPEKKVYTLDVSEAALTLDDDGEGSFEVTTNGTFTVEVDDESVCTATADGNIVTVKGVKAGDTFITVTSVEDKDLSKEVNVTVNAVVMTITIDFSELTAASDVASVEVTYSNDSDPNNYDAEVTYTAGATTATAAFEKKYSNEWGWFSGITVTLKDANGNVIESELTSNNYLEFSVSGGTLSVGDIADVDADLVITLSGFEGVTKVTVAVGPDKESMNDPIEATLSEDGKTATVKVNSSVRNAPGWFNTEIIVYAGDVVLKSTMENTWLEFNAEGMAATVSFVDESEVWIKLLDAESIIGISDATQLLVSSEDFEGLSVKKLKIEAADAADIWWASVYSSSEWGNECSLLWNDEIKGYSGEILNPEVYVENGLYYAGATAKVTVSYVAE